MAAKIFSLRGIGIAGGAVLVTDSLASVYTGEYVRHLKHGGMEPKIVKISEETREKINDKWEIGKAHTQSTIDMIRENPSTLPKVSVIVGAGATGVLLGYRDRDMEGSNISDPSWPKGKAVSMEHKTSTCALFTPAQELHSFGYGAEQKYNELTNDSKHHNWYYFRRFKMLLYETPDLNVRLELTDNKGNCMPALDVFAKSIEYLKDRCLQEFERTKKDHPVEVRPSDIHWVLTVPAIWDDKAKQFMREAAIHMTLEIIVEKGEIAEAEQFLLLPQ